MGAYRPPHPCQSNIHQQSSMAILYGPERLGGDQRINTRQRKTVGYRRPPRATDIDKSLARLCTVLKIKKGGRVNPSSLNYYLKFNQRPIVSCCTPKSILATELWLPIVQEPSLTCIWAPDKASCAWSILPISCTTSSDKPA